MPALDSVRRRRRHGLRLHLAVLLLALLLEAAATEESKKDKKCLTIKQEKPANVCIIFARVFFTASFLRAPSCTLRYALMRKKNGCLCFCLPLFPFTHKLRHLPFSFPFFRGNKKVSWKFSPVLFHGVTPISLKIFWAAAPQRTRVHTSTGIKIQSCQGKQGEVREVVEFGILSKWNEREGKGRLLRSRTKQNRKLFCYKMLIHLPFH